MSSAVSIENVSKQYRLGVVGTGTLAHDLNRFWARLRGRPDPALKIDATNDRTIADQSGYVWALKDINLEVEQGEILGVIGANGAGKSTLLKLLSRVTAPTEGEIKVKGRMASLLEVGTGFHPELTGRENIFLNGAILGMTKPEIATRIDEIVEFSGCAKYIDTPVKRYSSGMMVRLGFAVAAHLECEILVVDEVLAVGDVAFQRKCIGKLKELGASSGRTILFVSHNMASIAKMCGRAVLMHQGGIEKIGDTTEIIQQYYEMQSVGFIREDENDSPIRAVNILRNGERSDFICMGDRLGIEVEYCFEQRQRSPRFGLGVSTELGVRVFSAGTHWSNFDTSALSNRGRMVCDLGEVPLNAGNYQIKIAITDENGSPVDQREIGAVLRVEPMDILSTGRLPSSTQGMIIWQSTWEKHDQGPF
ncbi:MAG: ABC transporter ATP-binding protein [Planctomycetota bacterium]